MIGFAYAMIVPPFLGQEVIRSAGQIADEKGYVKVRDTYQADGFDNVYAVGIAAAVEVAWHTATPAGVPKAGSPTERMAHVAARNTAAQIRGEPPRPHEAFGGMPAVCVMDAGNNGVIILADKMLPPRKQASSSWTAGSRHEARLREVLPVEGPSRVRPAPLTRPGQDKPPRLDLTNLIIDE